MTGTAANRRGALGTARPSGKLDAIAPALAAVADVFLGKPVGLERLLAILDDACGAGTV